MLYDQTTVLCDNKCTSTHDFAQMAVPVLPRTPRLHFPPNNLVQQFEQHLASLISAETEESTFVSATCISSSLPQNRRLHTALPNAQRVSKFCLAPFETSKCTADPSSAPKAPPRCSREPLNTPGFAPPRSVVTCRPDGKTAQVQFSVTARAWHRHLFSCVPPIPCVFPRKMCDHELQEFSVPHTGCCA